MILFILRGAFVVLVAAVAALYLLSNQGGAQVGFGVFTISMLGALALAAAVVAIDVGTRHKRLSALSGVFLGLVAGLLAAYTLSFVVDLIGLLTAPEITLTPPPTYTETQLDQMDSYQRNAWRAARGAYQQQLDRREAYFNLLEGVKVVIGLITCYLGISLVLQTKDDFRFVIPYVEFAKQIRGNRPTLLDTSVIVDGRVLDIVQTKVMQGLLVVPKFVLNELQAIADSADKLRRARGRRGLEILQKLQECPIVDVSIEETDPAEEGATVDQKLILLAQRLQARIMTNDYNLNKVATLRGVDVINLNDLAKAMRPVVLPGEHLSVKVVKPGEGPAQGVGYLEDGTMVVVEGGRHHLGQEVNLVVTSTLQTSAGRMIFGRYEGHEEPPHDSQPSTSASPHEAAASSEPTPSASPDESETASPASHRPPRGPSGRNPRRIR